MLVRRKLVIPYVREKQFESRKRGPPAGENIGSPTRPILRLRLHGNYQLARIRLAALSRGHVQAFHEHLPC